MYKVYGLLFLLVMTVFLRTLPVSAASRVQAEFLYLLRAVMQTLAPLNARFELLNGRRARSGKSIVTCRVT